MAQSHTWNFYLTAGRTWGGPRISGATITAYNTQTGSTVVKSLTTNANGYATYTLTGSTISPQSYYWRVNIGNIFGDYYSGKNVIGSGSTDGYFDIPSSYYNSSGVLLMSSSFRPALANSTGTITVYLFAVGSNVTIPSSKFLTHFDVLSLVPPRTTNLTSGATRMTLNQCITESEMLEYERGNAFSNQIGFTETSDLVVRSNIQEYNRFISGTSVPYSLSTTSLYFKYNTTESKTVRVTLPSDFTVDVSITGVDEGYFSAAPTQVNSTTIDILVSPTNFNLGNFNRTVTLVINFYVIDSHTWFGGPKQTGNVVLTQSCPQPGGGGSQT